MWIGLSQRSKKNIIKKNYQGWIIIAFHSEEKRNIDVSFAMIIIGWKERKEKAMIKPITGTTKLKQFKRKRQKAHKPLFPFVTKCRPMMCEKHVKKLETVFAPFDFFPESELLFVETYKKGKWYTTPCICFFSSRL